jgi:hypothetical protein
VRGTNQSNPNNFATLWTYQKSGWAGGSTLQSNTGNPGLIGGTGFQSIARSHQTTPSIT